MRERWSSAFDALSEDELPGPSSRDAPTQSSVASGRIWSETFEASQLAILQSGGWTPSTRAKRKRVGSREMAGRASGNEASTGDATDRAAARK